MHHFEGI